jgi:hypothetical protein
MLDINKVRNVEECNDQLPPKFANQLYSTGENRYGGKDFTVVMKDGSRFYYTVGSVMDFLSYPAGYTKSDVAAVEDGHRPETEPKEVVPQISYTWCLYQEPSEIVDRLRYETLTA